MLKKTFDGMDKLRGEALLAPPASTSPVLAVMDEVKVKGVSHITGGGFYENIPAAWEGLRRPAYAKADVRHPALFE